MLSPEETEKLVLAEAVDYGNEIIPFDMALGRVLAETIKVGNEFISPGTKITPIVISSLVSVGELEVRVKRLPRLVVIACDSRPTVQNQQIKSPESYLLQAALKEQGIEGVVLSFSAEIEAAKNLLQQCLHNFDAMLFTESVDRYVFSALKELSVTEVIHDDPQLAVSFWLGKHENGSLAFVFRGDTKTTLSSFNQYFIHWLNASLQLVE